MPDRYLIVNADDLGRTLGINQGIFEAHRSGIVSSATMMVNYPAAVHAVEGLAEVPHLGIGLHVALTGGVPTLPAHRLPSLVDTEGHLPAKPEGLIDPDPEEVLAEIRAQLARFRELTGHTPTHFDSHHHSHRIPSVCDALIQVAGECGRPVRRASAAVHRRLETAEIQTSDAFVECFFAEEATKAVLLEILGELGPGTTELMCHPGRIDPELAAGSSYVAERERELSILTDPEIQSAVSELGLRLATFQDLADARP